MKINKRPQEQSRPVEHTCECVSLRVCVGSGGAEGRRGEGMVSQMSKKHQESQVFVPVHPLARAFGENSVKLLSQVYWSLGLLEREVIYPSVIGKILAAVSGTTLTFTCNTDVPQLRQILQCCFNLIQMVLRLVGLS